MKLCDYGCGQMATHYFKNGKKCCSNNVSLCEGIKKVIGKKSKGRIPSEKTIEAVKKYRTGRKDSDKTKKLKSQARQGSKNPMYGKIHSSETKERISKSKIGKIPYNKYTIKVLKEKHLFFSKIEEMRYNPNKLEEKEIQVHCKNHNCSNSKEKGGWFTPTPEQITYRKNMLENEGEDKSYFYCSKECKNTCPLYRSRGNDPYKEIYKPYTQEEYQTFRTFVLERDSHICQFCGKLATVVHHERPQKLEPFFALDPDFAWSCCEECHYEKAHKDECSTGKLASRVC
jgi:hypothetical protein